MSIASDLRGTAYKNIFILLKRRRITQSELAAAIGVSKQRISDWKAGRKNPSVSLLMKTADYLDVSVDYLLGRNCAKDSHKS
jgi:transcriptional regulator with XRE-family HTH domain